MEYSKILGAAKAHALETGNHHDSESFIKGANFVTAALSQQPVPVKSAEDWFLESEWRKKHLNKELTHGNICRMLEQYASQFRTPTVDEKANELLES